MRNLCLAIGLLLVALHAHAMEVSVRPAGLLLSGEIRPGDYDRLINFFQSDPKKFVTTQNFLLDSPGGSVPEALKIALFIRDTSRVTNVEAKSNCLSACFYLFVAGGSRTAAADGSVGIHRPYYNPHQFGARRIQA